MNENKLIFFWGEYDCRNARWSRLGRESGNAGESACASASGRAANVEFHVGKNLVNAIYFSKLVNYPSHRCFFMGLSQGYDGRLSGRAFIDGEKHPHERCQLHQLGINLHQKMSIPDPKEWEWTNKNSPIPWYRCINNEGRTSMIGGCTQLSLYFSTDRSWPAVILHSFFLWERLIFFWASTFLF